MKMIKYTTIALLILISITSNAQLTFNGSGTTETRMWAHGNYISRYWAINYLSAYSFGIDASAIGNIWSNYNASNPTRIFSFSDSWINGFNFNYSSFGIGRYNRFHQSNTSSYGEAFGFDFNPSLLHELVVENAYSEGSGMYFDGDYAVLWSPGDHDRLLRVYDEDGMIEKAYIDGNGYYHTNSDKRCKENIVDVKDALSKVRKMRGVEYNHKYTNFYYAPTNLKETINGHEVKRNDTIETKTENSNKYYGFIAQEIEEVIPEVVSQDEKGNRFVNYDAIIPILVEAIKDLDSEVEQLKSTKNQKSSNLKSAKIDNDVTSLEANETSTIAQLYQNHPNPFNNSTEISFYLPRNITTAYLNIYDMQGTQLKSILITQRGNSSITIMGSELRAGMYFYALIADGQEIDTKRMILTN